MTLQHAEFHQAITLNVIMLSVIMLSIIMLNIVMLNVVGCSTDQPSVANKKVQVKLKVTTIK
jgi:hypothetical protein